MPLDINRLIEVAQDAMHDPQISFAASAEYPMQDFIFENQKYRMFITIKHMDVVDAEAARMIPYSEPDEEGEENI